MSEAAKKLIVTEGKSVMQARHDAQKLAFGPIAFAAAKALRDTGILAALSETEPKAVPVVAEEVGLSEYGARVLLESGLGSELVARDDDDGYRITNTGKCILTDELTRVNMDFVFDVCYRGMFELEASIRDSRPAGLPSLGGNWKTVYEGLSSLNQDVRDSWLSFDHFYSDTAFGPALKVIFERPTKYMMDIGGNTGRFAMRCCEYDDEVSVTIVDLPGQTEMAVRTAAEKGFEDRLRTHPTDLLGDEPLPTGFDGIWMSQFLCCFSEEQIQSILTRAAQAMGPASRLYILDTYWDRQSHETAAYCLLQTSLYFTCIANGDSRMYHSDTMKQLVEKSGLEVERVVDPIGLSHTLFVCKRKELDAV